MSSDATPNLTLPLFVTELDYNYTYNLFFKLFSSLRDSDKYYEAVYQYIAQSTKRETTKKMKKLADLATIFYYNELEKNREYYERNESTYDELVDKSIEYAIANL